MTTERKHPSTDAAARTQQCAPGSLRLIVRRPGRDAGSPTARGFTLVEMMIVVAIVAVLAAVLVMPALGARMRSNETVALASLRTVATQQENFRSQTVVDQDANGVGEFGLLAELAGVIVARRAGATAPIAPRMIDSSFTTDANGFAMRCGFYCQVYLATDANAGAGNDADLGGDADTPGVILDDLDGVTRQEYYWCAYAWPAGRNTGERAFFIDHGGIIYQTHGDAVTYAGTETVPEPDAAYGGALFTSTPASGDGHTGNDGNCWTVVQ